MALLNPSQIKAIVFESLKTVADLSSQPEDATFASMSNFQKHVFLSALKRKLNASPYYMNDGSTTFLAYYDVILRPDTVDEWPTVKDCIEWINLKQIVVYL